uniref:Uncharacterized protein n=1 Tax=Anopheles funestus TaxID=62324 RepID=A0A182S1L6_ANOFN
MRRTSRLSSMPNSITASRPVLRFSSRLSNFSACTTVRGKPSSKNPLRHSGLSRLESIMSTTNSSETSLPSSITFFSCAPSLDPAAISARSISPVDK